MNTRRASVELIYNGVTVTEQITPYCTGFSYTDPASGEADSLDISLHDRDRRWLGAWFPVVGDTLSATIRTQNWGTGGGVLPCGRFVLDEFRFSGWPVSGTLSAVSVPADSGFRETERTKNWENITIEEIGKEIAQRAGISLVWDVEDEAFVIACVEQSEETDCEFYMNLCETYGLAMKIYSNRLVVYDREAYKKKRSVRTLAAGDLLSWSWSQSMSGVYTGGEYAYTDPTSEEEILVTVGGGNRILKQSGKADSRADAERKIRAAVAASNHGAVKLSVSIMGNAALAAAQCVDVTGLGKLCGKYYIDRITHSVGSGYTMELELSLVQ